ncbi:MAG: hypothetical protein DRO09_04035 [Thermoprotei archaeon]|nr:MAG: hypothetical protein DRO09_04035 [Thermoprotei archaeon]
MNATKDHAFHLGEPPELQLESVDKATGGWGETWTFTVQCRDLEGDTDTVYLWKKRDSASPWELVDQQNCTSAAFITLTFEETFACSDITPSGENTLWKFNASDQWNFTDETPTHTITIERDDVSIGLVSGHDEQVDREGSDYVTLSLQIYDTDRQEYLPSGVKGKFYITINGTAWDSGTEVLTGENGYLTYNFDPTCNYSVGLQKWKGGTEGDACYKDKMSTEYNLEIFGQLKDNIVTPQKGTTFHTTELVTIRVNITSDCANEGAIPNAAVRIYLRSPLDDVEECTPVYNETGAFAGYYNCTWDSTLKKPGWWDILVNATKDYYHYNYSEFNDWFYLQNTPTDYSNITVTPNEAGWGATFNYTVNVSDVDYDDVTCTLYISKDGGNTFSSVGTGSVPGGHGICYVTYNFACADIGNDNYFYFVIQDGYNTVETPTYQGPNVTKDTLVMYHIAGNNGFVNRSTGSLLLKIGVDDIDKGTAAADDIVVKFNVTYDGDNFTKVGEANTSAGTASIDFAPDCSFEVGPQKWFAYIDEDACYYFANTSMFNLTIIGTLINTIIQPNGEEFYLGEENVTIRANVTDECGNLISVDYINFTSINVDRGKRYYCAPVLEESTGYYNCTFNTSGMYPRWYDVEVYANKTYYNSDRETKTNAFWLETRPILKIVTAYSEQGTSVGGWGETWTFKVNVTDWDKDAVTVYLYERPAGSSEWRLLTTFGKTKPSGVATQIVTFTYAGYTCSDLLDSANREWFVNGTDDPGGTVEDYAETGIGTITLEKDDIAIYLDQGNNEALNRSNVTNGERVTLRVQIYDLDRDAGINTPDTGKFWVTKDGSTYILDLQLSTIEPGGYISDEFPSSDRCNY